LRVVPYGVCVVLVLVELLDCVDELLACPNANPLIAIESTRIQSFFIFLSCGVPVSRMLRPLRGELLARAAVT
jgi:hypothetical protein